MPFAVAGKAVRSGCHSPRTLWPHHSAAAAGGTKNRPPGVKDFRVDNANDRPSPALSAQHFPEILKRTETALPYKKTARKLRSVGRPNPVGR
jgi:hypothetical protein